MKRWKRGLFLFVSIGIVVVAVTNFALCDSITLSTQLGAGGGLWTGEDTDSDANIDAIHPNDDSWRVGIGTTAPSGTLDVQGGTAPGDQNGTNITLDAQDGGPISLVTGTNGGNIILMPGNGVGTGSTGNVGIGTTSPASKLDVEGGVAVGATYSGTSAAPTNGMIIEGNVGIGTDAPGAPLHVVGVNDAASNVFFLPGADTGAAGLPDLRVGVGATTPSHRLHVVDELGGSWRAAVLAAQTGNNVGGMSFAGWFHAAGPANEKIGVRAEAINATRNAAIWVPPNQGGVSIGYGDAISGIANGTPPNNGMIVAGNVGIGTTTPTNPLRMGSGAHVTSGGVWTDASSIEYKTDIALLTLDKALEALSDLKPVTFGFKAAPDERHVGFIAEEVPDLVATKDRKGLSPMDIVAVLTKVVQQQQKEIDELKARFDK